MQRILEAFANDAIRVEADIGNRSKEHQRVCDQSRRLEEKLEKRLKKKERKLFNELMDVLANESSYYAEERFIHGFRLGTLMTTEVFMDSDICLWKDRDRG